MVGYHHRDWRRSTLGKELESHCDAEQAGIPVMRLRADDMLCVVAQRPDGLWQWAVYPTREDGAPTRREAWGVEESRELAMAAAANHEVAREPSDA